MTEPDIIDLTPETITEHSLCGYSNKKNEGYRRKATWLQQQYETGVRAKVLNSADHGDVGYIEYMPAENGWRAVDAPGYLLIQCIGIFKKDYKEKGYGSMLVRSCIDHARQQGMHGVVTVTSTRTWLAGSALFEKNGFESVDDAPPCFSLHALRFDDAPLPRFPDDWNDRLDACGKGLTLIHSDQCPYLINSFPDVLKTAREDYGIEPNIIDVSSAEYARTAPSAYGVCGVVFDGELVADHPISKGRFRNIMKTVETSKSE